MLPVRNDLSVTQHHEALPGQPVSAPSAATFPEPRKRLILRSVRPRASGIWLTLTAKGSRQAQSRLAPSMMRIDGQSKAVTMTLSAAA